MEKNDYTDPVCPFETKQWEKNPEPERIPIGRILEKEDGFLNAKDYEGAKKLLLYWENEATANRDERGAFQMKNELMGIYRKTGAKEEAMKKAAEALDLTSSPEIGEESEAAATAYINAATVYNAFGHLEKTAILFEKARSIYEKNLPPGDSKLGALYNNMGIDAMNGERYADGEKWFQMALETMQEAPAGEAEMAITCLNLCDLYMRRDGEILVPDEAQPADAEGCLQVPPETDRMIAGLLEKAWAYLNTESALKKEDYAFIAEKCAPSFSYYGWQEESEELSRRSRELYREKQQERKP